MPSKGTTARNVRVPDDVWEAAKTKAEEAGTNVSALVQEFLREYVTPPPPRGQRS